MEQQEVLNRLLRWRAARPGHRSRTRNAAGLLTGPG